MSARDYNALSFPLNFPDAPFVGNANIPGNCGLCRRDIPHGEWSSVLGLLYTFNKPKKNTIDTTNRNH